MQRIARGVGRSLVSLAAMAIAFGPSAAKADFISYQLETVIPVPPAPDNQAPGGAFTTYDISFFDATTPLSSLGYRPASTDATYSSVTNMIAAGTRASPGTRVVTPTCPP